jgi:orotate phosphoribosyltransferase
MMTNEQALQLFIDSGAYLEGHFELTSGRHSGVYLEKFQVLQWPKYTEQLCRELAERFRDTEIDVVVGPVTGGVVLAYEVGKNLGTRGIFTERENGKMALRRGFKVAGEKVLIVEDVVTTGGSVFEVIDAVKEAGGEVVGVGYLVDRSGGKVDFGVKQIPLLKVDVESFEPSECPLCAKGMPITKRGSRKL